MEKKWWHNKIAYQIYPKSFCDSNGDGIGDLPGIISKLDYLKDLGVDILWISPVYVSPLADQGYDIADYQQIDPRFGTMEDMDRLIKEAKARGLHLLMDLVVNHCSDEHIWFKKACEDPEGKYGAYFYLKKKSPDGSLPTNWRSYFGGPAWDRLGDTDWYYFHAFHKKQPDLNWENPELREEIYKMMNWWLDKGLDGFRVDAIINIKKPLPFRNYPADRADGLCDLGSVMDRAQGIGEFLREMRDRTFAPHDSFSVGEVFNIKDSQLNDFMGPDGYFSSIFDFSQMEMGKSIKGWYDCKEPRPEDYKNCCFKSQKKAERIGFFSNIIENHDEPRGVSYYLPEYARSEKGKKLLAAMYFMLRGIPFIYQGQELGMENIAFESMEEVDDVSTIEEYRVAREAGLSEEESLRAVNLLSRDNTRTPFQWNDGPEAGFTTGKPWLRVNPNYRRINAAAQEKRDDSVLSFYKELIRLRKEERLEEAAVYGKTEPVLTEERDIMAYFRRGQGCDLLVIGNFRSEPAKVALEELKKRQVKLLLTNGETFSHEGGQITLEPLQAVILECV